MKRFKGILKKVFLVLVAVLLVLIAAYLLRNLYWGRQIESRLAMLRAAGQPTTIADWEKISVPQRDNAAPIYMQAFKAMAEPAAAKDVETICRVLYTRSRTPNLADWAAAKSALARCDRIFSLIAEAQSKPECQLSAPLIYRNLRPESLEKSAVANDKRIREWAGLRSAARLLSARALLAAREGKTKDVVSCAESALKVTEADGRRAVLIDYLVKVAIVQTVLRNLRQALDYCQPGESELRQLDRAFSLINVPELYKRGLEGESVYFSLQNNVYRRCPMPFINGDTLAYLDFTSRLLKCTDMNYSAARSKGLVGRKIADSLPSCAVFAKILAPVVVRAAGKRYECEAEIACCRAFLGLRAYKARFGEYPQTLNDLKSKLDWQLPKDPFTGRDMVYKRVGSGFIVYSLGYDLKDNGGTAIRSTLQTEPRGDIVWKATH